MHLTDPIWRDCIAIAARAPSPHNTQPARWRWQGNRIELCEDPSRWLAAGDPQGRDQAIALGMAWEAMRLALSSHGIGVAEPACEALAYPPDGAVLRRVAAAALVTDAAVDALAVQQMRRCSFRGKFAHATTTQAAALDRCLDAHAGIATPIATTLHRDVARWYDLAAAHGLADARVASELYRWMRWKRRDPRWTRDGLAADCLMLGNAEAFAASWLMHPRALRVLSAFGLTRILLSESAKVESATRLVMIHADQDATTFDAGRRWYRFWLSLCEAGCSAVPMSALVDVPEFADRLLQAQPLAPGQRLLNVMRVGPTPQAVPRSARLPVDEFVLS